MDSLVKTITAQMEIDRSISDVDAILVTMNILTILKGWGSGS